MDLHTAGHRQGVVAAPHHAAVEAGRATLAAGGNALEAMVAAAATISVVYPHMNGIGGDSFWLIHAPGNDVTTPILLREVKPSYTSDAMRAKVQGSVLLECLVRPDGSVGDVRVVRSPDPPFGLDLEAMKAARQWRFAPGTKGGEPVRVVVTIEIEFRIGTELSWP